MCVLFQTFPEIPKSRTAFEYIDSVTGTRETSVPQIYYVRIPRLVQHCSKARIQSQCLFVVRSGNGGWTRRARVHLACFL